MGRKQYSRQNSSITKIIWNDFFIFFYLPHFIGKYISFYPQCLNYCNPNHSTVKVKHNYEELELQGQASFKFNECTSMHHKEKSLNHVRQLWLTQKYRYWALNTEPCMTVYGLHENTGINQCHVMFMGMCNTHMQPQKLHYDNDSFFTWTTSA